MRHPLKYWTWAFAFGSAVHLTLPDIQQPGWLLPAVLEGLGVLLLIRRPNPLGFFLCFLGTLVPLLWYRDVLTQSMLLTWFAALGFFGSLWPRLNVLESIRWITAGTYWLAALHKLNSHFLQPEVSCAHHAWRQIDEHWGQVPLIQGVGVELPILIILLEVFIGCLIVRRSLWLWPTALLFHWPLTITLAPAFGFVMLAGCASALTPRQISQMRSIARQKPVKILVGIVLFLGLEGLLTGGVPSIAILLKGVVFATIFMVAILVLVAERGWDRRGPLLKAKLSRFLLVVWIMHGMTPYLALQYQHTAAMLSNLRIDADCHNSLIFPASWASPDPYIRIDEVSIGSGQRPKREVRLKDGLWSLTALATMHKNWCITELRPIVMSGTWRDQPFKITDLCNADWYTHLGLENLEWPGFQGFQKNLSKRCSSACIH